MQLEKSLGTDCKVGATRCVAKALLLRAGVVRLNVRALGVGARTSLRMFWRVFLAALCNAGPCLVTSCERRLGVPFAAGVSR
jgi:hypothetical protein